MALPGWKKWAKSSIKAVVALVVLWAVGRHVLRTWSDLADRSVSFRFEPTWLVGAGLLYLGGLSAFGRFYHRILWADGSRVRFVDALRAYLVSHLGKYVPGKAMVVVIRAGMMVPFGVSAPTAAIAAFYETLVMMAAGGPIAALGFAIAPGSRSLELLIPRWGPIAIPVYRLAALTGLGVGLVFLVATLPSVFTRVAGLLSSPIPGAGPEAVPRLTGRLLVEGLLWSSVGWLLLGLSQLAVIRSFDTAAAATFAQAGVVAIVVASVALATVAGFLVAVLPGGLGVREGVLMSALEPVLGTDRSVVAALVLRLVWVAAELAAAAVLGPGYWSKPPRAMANTVWKSDAGAGST